MTIFYRKNYNILVIICCLHVWMLFWYRTLAFWGRTYKIQEKSVMHGCYMFLWITCFFMHQVSFPLPSYSCMAFFLLVCLFKYNFLSTNFLFFFQYPAWIFHFRKAETWKIHECCTFVSFIIMLFLQFNPFLPRNIF